LTIPITCLTITPPASLRSDRPDRIARISDRFQTRTLIAFTGIRIKTATMRPEWENAYLASILCLNTTARSCELKALQWAEVDLFARTLSIGKSKTPAGERLVPLTDVAVSALARLRKRAESFGSVEPSHYVFAAFVPKFSFSGKKIIDFNLTRFDPTGLANVDEEGGAARPPVS
jgi:integrase